MYMTNKQAAAAYILNAINGLATSRVDQLCNADLATFAGKARLSDKGAGDIRAKIKDLLAPISERMQRLSTPKARKVKAIKKTKKDTANGNSDMADTTSTDPATSAGAA
jgi:hypothetical protein